MYVKGICEMKIYQRIAMLYSLYETYNRFSKDADDVHQNMKALLKTAPFTFDLSYSSPSPFDGKVLIFASSYGEFRATHSLAQGLAVWGSSSVYSTDSLVQLSDWLEKPVSWTQDNTNPVGN